MLKIGSHVSISDGLLGAAKEAHSYNSNTFMIYTGPPQNTRGKDYIEKEALKYIVQHPVTRNLPIILETPWLDKKTNLYKEEIAFLRGDL